MTAAHKAILLAASAVGLVACGGLHDTSDPGNLVPKTVDEDATLPSISFAGSRFHFETFGDPAKPVIIFLHGGPGGDYRGLLRLKDRYGGYALIDDYFLVFWDQRGSGLSRRHDCDVFSLDGAAADLDALVDMVSPGRPVTLVGHSWGGMYATLYIDRHPEKVAGAVLMEPGPLNAAAFERIEKDLYDVDFFSEWLNDYAWSSRFVSPDDHARADYQRLLGMRDSQPKYHQEMDHDPAPVWRLGAVANACIMRAGMKDGRPVYDFTKRLALYTRRVLFIASANNEVIGVTFQESQRSSYPSSDLAVIADSGHDMQWTHPAETLAAIHSYLEAVK